MTPEAKKEFEDKIQAYVGREISARKRGLDDVNKVMIRQWCEVMGDKNPVYTDEEFAKKSSKGGLIAPPTMLQVWGMEGYSMATDPKEDLQRELHKIFDAHGYTGVLGTNCDLEFKRDLRPGDQVYAREVFESISDEKATSRGLGYFIETRTVFTDQSGEEVGNMKFRVLKFVPDFSSDKATQDAAAAGESEKVAAPTRIHSPRGHDNAWWWEAVDQGKVLIQRCKSCQTLRHPPRPMCGECQSMEWDSIESALEGTVFSFTQIHYPKVPGYQYPLVCAVISLSEGTRLVANVVGCDPEDVTIGMRVKGAVEPVDEATMLPQFYPAG
ncbi:MAG: bifunctional MaoC family dehydratase/OB-fold nucleic acid binding domain-containing protein [Halioglobus sp.]|nr:bifunctional MaoC family dehydratase/OB-fold nucleic acid binding domain-containing protein [Halioglobus sp.]